MKRYIITELADTWLIDGQIEIPRKPKKKKRRTWFEEFVYDLFNFYN